MTYRPPSRRNKPDPLYDELQEGIPNYLLQPVLDWIVERVSSRNHRSGSDEDILKYLQLGVRHMAPLDWSTGGVSASRSLQQRVKADREDGLDVLDFLLHFKSTSGQADALNVVLRFGGSAWEAISDEHGQHQLTRRAVGPVVQTMDAIKSESPRAHAHLMKAWSRLMGRNPDPSTAYRESVRAVEAVAKPVVTPKDELATLGKIIRALRDKPKKWTYVLDGTTAEDVAAMADSIWLGQLDRHGADEADAPLNVSQEQADAAFHVALALTRIFAGRLLDTA